MYPTTLTMNNKKGGPKPPVICYICGRQYGSHSIGIHEPKCLEKWHIENKKLPKSQRRSEPKRPEVVMDENGEVDVEATNEVRWDNAQKLLVQCENCGRRFAEDRLSVHQRSCTPENPAKSVYKGKQKSRSVSSKRNGQSDSLKAPLN
nr:zinc finger protein 474-like [Haemonchus contortus]